MLLPKLLEPADHATAANLLIAHLAEATRLGAAAEALIRLPVLATLGLLTVDAGTAKKLLTAVLNVISLNLSSLALHVHVSTPYSNQQLHAPQREFPSYCCIVA